MDPSGKIVAITGAAGGIGRALCERFVEESASAVVAIDIEREEVARVADQLSSADVPVIARCCDVAAADQVSRLVAEVEQNVGPIDIFCSNAGIAFSGGIEVSEEHWQRIWEVNVMAHVYAARALLPSMLARRSGYLCNTASAAGLLTNLGAVSYTVTKHAAVALAEWLSITYGSRGIGVSCLCPQGVRTPMLLGAGGLTEGVARRAVMAAGELMEPSTVAAAALEGIRAERFLILPHPKVAEYLRRKAEDEERWLTGMRRMQVRLEAESTSADG